MKTSPITFKAKILQHGTMNAAYVEFPFSVFSLFGKKGQVKVQVLFDEKVKYRGSLSKMRAENHFLILTQQVRKELGKTFGDEVYVAIWEDKEKRTIEVPEDVMALFNVHSEAFERYQKLSYTHQKEYIRWITEAKKTETRTARKNKMIEMILSGKKGI